MDYIVGSVAALISGNVTPSRPKIIKRALTPMKHQQSPNVTPKSELVDDRSIFLSPTTQKKKAIVKKSPKRIFENPDLDITNDESNISVSPKADKVKKHLVEQLENDKPSTSVLLSPKSPKKKREQINSVSPKKNIKLNDIDMKIENTQNHDKTTPKKNKIVKSNSEETSNGGNLDISTKSTKKKKRSESLLKENVNEKENNVGNGDTNKPDSIEPMQIKKKKNKQKKGLDNDQTTREINEGVQNISNEVKNVGKKSKKFKLKKQNVVEVNPNAITQEDSDSEHESDDEVDSDDEQNKQVLSTGPPESSDEEETKVETKKENTGEQSKQHEDKEVSQDEIKRTLFVGNVPFSNKCKKEIKKIFNKFGDIETVRIRTVPVKDARTTPKLAVIKNELHPDRQTVNVYIKYRHADSVDKALSANNTVLNEHHLRVFRSDTSGAAHDPKRSIFVGNIPFAMEDEALWALFKRCGEIQSVRIIRDRKTNAGKGFGYVNFASKDGVELALAMTEEDLTIKNRIIRVKRCTQYVQKQGKNVAPRKFQPPAKRNEEMGALRRLNHKRKFQENNEGPPRKRSSINQPEREKKQRKEFVGMTADKKKKRKFSKGQKQKKILSEILTK
ncbi:uncharacterized protein LOC126972292 [Leptidea sinapis]|uniref:uncharacterized protein LOC126972292 n=1 Tax=Leptidea sinapis TaxID=189913 RepID=UPI00214705FA|nr:uncharacterized protein LOC126972292 [Leptidea sinapis]